MIKISVAEIKHGISTTDSSDIKKMTKDCHQSFLCTKI